MSVQHLLIPELACGFNGFGQAASGWVGMEHIANKMVSRLGNNEGTMPKSLGRKFQEVFMVSYSLF